MEFDSIGTIYENIPTDWLIIGVFAIFAAFDSLRSGARRACTVALAIPITTFLLTLLPQTIVLNTVLYQFANPFLEAIIFGALFVVLYILISRFDFAWGDDSGQTIQAALAGVAATVIVVTFWIATPALDTLWHFGPQIQAVFGEAYRFWWIIASFATLGFVRNS